MEMAVDKGIEHELWISFVVAHLSLIGHSVAFLSEVQTDGVDADAVVVE